MSEFKKLREANGRFENDDCMKDHFCLSSVNFLQVSDVRCRVSFIVCTGFFWCQFWVTIWLICCEHHKTWGATVIRLITKETRGVVPITKIQKANAKPM